MSTIETISRGERERLITYIADAHNEVMRAVLNLTDEQLNFKPGPERWSISENVEHLTIIHNLVFDHVLQVIASSPSPKESAWKGRDERLLERTRDRTHPLKVPEIGLPKNQWSHEELFFRFTEIRDRMTEFAATTDAPLRDFCFPHPIYGEKDCYQWLLGTGAHCERHLAQIREVILSPDFPTTF